MTTQRRKKRQKILILFLAFLFIIVFTVVNVDSRIRPTIKEVAKNKAVLMSQKALNDAVEEEMQSTDIGYDSLVHTEYGEDGEVKSLQVDTAKLNLLKANITNRAIEKIEAYKNEYIQIPIGILLDSDLLIGIGPKFRIDLSVSGNVLSDIKSSFQKSGINQTHHCINLNFKFSVYAIIPGYNTSVDINSSITVAETVIVGEVPSNFTEIGNTPTDDQLDYLFNFKSE